MPQLQQGGGDGNATALTQKQKADIERVRRDMAGTRAQLRDVQRNLRTEIDRWAPCSPSSTSSGAGPGGGFRHRVRPDPAPPRAGRTRTPHVAKAGAA